MRDCDIQDLCERGQQELIGTHYLQAVDTFITAEQAAWDAQAFDTLSRLYLPLQEARRQVRQRCGEGAVHMHLCSSTSQEQIDPVRLLAESTGGQLLTAGWGTTAPAVELRRLAHERHLYVETFLGATFPIDEGKRIVAVLPLEESPLPTAEPRNIDALRPLLPANALLIPFDELPPDFARGTTDSYASVMALWERLHRPFLEAGDRETDPIKKMEAYRLTLRVDPACELAHQKLADVARVLARQQS